MVEKLEGFIYKECEVAGDPCWLVTPEEMGTKWTEDNKRFRSAIIRQSDGFVVSSGFRKFTNFHETPEFEPWDPSWPVEARHKMDGSLLIVSKYKGQLICRTRGTVDARQLPNGHEIDGLIEKYRLADYFSSGDFLDVSFLFEWTTPTNVIVVREHNEPTLTLLGAVYNNSGDYFLQSTLNFFYVNRPKRYTYASIAECMADVAAWKGSEGVVLYSPDGQTLKKIKAEEYLRLHRLKSSVSSIRSLIGVYIEAGAKPNADSFFNYIESLMDYEIAVVCGENIERIVEAHKYILELKNGVARVLERYKDYSQKEYALEITHRWNDWRRAYAFLYLKGKDIDSTMLGKIIEEKIKTDQ